MEAKSEVSTKSTKSTSLITSFLAGSLSGACSTVLLQPFDLIKTRIQQSPHSSVWAQTRLVAQTEGPLGLWRGVTPSLWRTVPGIGLHFASYHLLTSLVSDAGQPLSPLQSLAVGGLARVIAGTVLMPLTVIKTRWEAGGPQFGYQELACWGLSRQSSDWREAGGWWPVSCPQYSVTPRTLLSTSCSTTN